MNITEQEKNRIRGLHKNYSIIKEQETTVALTDQELKDMIDTDGSKLNWEGTNISSLYRDVTSGKNPTEYQFTGSEVHQALVKAKWNVDAFINQNDDLVNTMMESGANNDGTGMSAEDVKRLLELVIEDHTAKKDESGLLRSFRDGIEDVVDMYRKEMGIDSDTEYELKDMLWDIRNKTGNGFDTARWDVRSLKRQYPKAAMLLPPSKVMDFYCKFKK
jgi:hypothetical protein|tara:strand:+ start:49 stop:702 length:654 start_codon:yes stop_codon:yes gene_type:complete